MKTFFVTYDTNLKEFTDGNFPQGSFCLAALMRNKDIKVNGVRVNKNLSLKKGDEVIYYTTLKQEQRPSHIKAYEDENIYIADKLSGVSSEGLLSELKERGEFYAVHRLDRNTEGLIIFAKNGQAEGELLSAFKRRTVQKTYIALCKNCFIKDRANLTAYLTKDEKRGEVKVFQSPKEGAVKIITEYEVLQKSDDLAKVKIILHTGKTHQIRAHFAFLGCPVLGDEKYGDEHLNKKYAAKRQRLIAKYLTFNGLNLLSYLNGKTFESEFELGEF